MAPLAPKFEARQVEAISEAFITFLAALSLWQGDAGLCRPRRVRLAVVRFLPHLGPLDYLLYVVPALLLLTCSDQFDDVVGRPHDC